MTADAHKKVILLICLIWAAAATTAYALHDIYGSKLYWYTVAISLFMMAASLFVSFGHIRFVIPFIFLSDEDLLEYNVEKVGYLFGIQIASVSCALLFISMTDFAIFAVIGVCIAVGFGVFYAFVSKRFKARPQDA